MASRTAVGSPMTPAKIIELGAADRFPSAPADFSPTDEWIHTYRVWTCHGYRESGNENVGFLKISRVAGLGNGFTLHVEQQLVHSEAALHIMRAEIECRRDAIASMVKWTLSSIHTSPDGNVQKDLTVREQGSVTGDTLTVTINGRKSARKVGGITTADWCLFEAVQRLPFDKSVSLKFDVLEGLSIMRPCHRLSYRGVPVGQPGLQGFQQSRRSDSHCERKKDKIRQTDRLLRAALARDRFEARQEHDSRGRKAGRTDVRGRMRVVLKIMIKYYFSRLEFAHFDRIMLGTRRISWRTYRLVIP